MSQALWQGVPKSQPIIDLFGRLAFFRREDSCLSHVLGTDPWGTGPSAPR